MVVMVMVTVMMVMMTVVVLAALRVLNHDHRKLQFLLKIFIDFINIYVASFSVSSYIDSLCFILQILFEYRFYIL